MFSLLHAAHGIEDRADHALSPMGLSLSKLGVLTQLVDAGQALALSELASRLSCVRSNMTQLVDRLEDEGLVERVSDPADRRSVLAAVTDAGRQRHEQGAHALKQVQADLMTSLSGADRAALATMLAALD
jgi:DNA-binding MarR family transcriptional regulator